MKTTKLNQRNIKGILIFSIMLSGMLCAGVVKAQRAPRGSYSFSNYYRGGANTFNLGVEGGVSARSFVIKSDIDAIHQLKVEMEGWSAGLLFGGKNMNTRLVFGNYSTSTTVTKKAGQKSFGGQMSVYPFNLLGVKSKYFQPYIIGGIEVSQISFSGTYIPPSKLPPGANQLPCACTCEAADGPDQGSGPPPNPNDEETQPAPDLTAKPRVDKLLATQALAGIGLEIGFKNNGRFYTMFSEARYGIPLGVEALTAPLRETSISGQMALYFGIRIGLSK